MWVWLLGNGQGMEFAMNYLSMVALFGLGGFGTGIGLCAAAQRTIPHYRHAQ